MGAAYSFGRGDSGQLGHGEEQDEAVARRIEVLRGHCVKEVACGIDYTLFLVEEDELSQSIQEEIIKNKMT